MGDMTIDVFASTAFGKAAIAKIGSVSEDFRLFSSEWIGENILKSDTMKVVGAEFRIAKKGKNKGKLSIMVPNTTQTVYVNKLEIRKFKDA